MPMLRNNRFSVDLPVPNTPVSPPVSVTPVPTTPVPAPAPGNVQTGRRGDIGRGMIGKSRPMMEEEMAGSRSGLGRLQKAQQTDGGYDSSGINPSAGRPFVLGRRK